MKGPRQLKAMFSNDPNMRSLIDSLWRDYYGLYAEKTKKEIELDGNGLPIDPLIPNRISPDIDFGQALGMDNEVSGEKSLAIGMGNVINSFMEIALGHYPTVDESAVPDEWRTLNRLLTVGKGINQDNREDALILFKSGMLKLFNAVQIGAYDHRDENGELVNPEPGTLQYTEEKSLELWRNEKWNKVGDKFYRHTQLTSGRVWEVQHNLEKYPSVSIKDFDGNEYEAEVNHYSENILTITFSAPFAGYADCN